MDVRQFQLDIIEDWLEYGAFDDFTVIAGYLYMIFELHPIHNHRPRSVLRLEPDEQFSSRIWSQFTQSESRERWK